MKNMYRVSACAAVLGLSLVFSGVPAFAEELPSNQNSPEIVVPYSQCPNGGTMYKAIKDSYKFKQASGSRSRVSGDPGVTLRISTSRTFSVSGTISSTSSVSASVVLATVQSQLGFSISTSFSGTTENSGSWKVPKSYKRGGALAIGARVHSGAVQRWTLNVKCQPKNLVDAASYKAPQKGWYFKTYKL